MIATERLVLRPHTLDDFPSCVALWSDPRVTAFIGGVPSSEQQTWLRLLSYIGHWSLLGFGYWAVQLKSSGAYIGELGFADFKRDIEALQPFVPELGWAIVPSEQGKGYATEGLRAALSWGDRRFQQSKTVCIIHPDHLASLRVASKIGFLVEERIVYNGEETLLLARRNPLNSQ